jgi:hypothetical protein
VSGSPFNTQKGGKMCGRQRSPGRTQPHASKKKDPHRHVPDRYPSKQLGPFLVGASSSGPSPTKKIGCPLVVVCEPHAGSIYPYCCLNCLCPATHHHDALHVHKASRASPWLLVSHHAISFLCCPIDAPLGNWDYPPPSDLSHTDETASRLKE